jgi:hypothetical protein
MHVADCSNSCRRVYDSVHGQVETMVALVLHLYSAYVHIRPVSEMAADAPSPVPSLPLGERRTSGNMSAGFGVSVVALG